MIPQLSNRLDLPFDGSPDLRCVPAFTGVYLLTDDEDRPILAAHAENMRRAVAHRLSPPDPAARTKRADLSAVTRSVHWIETFSAFETIWRHYELVRTLYPASYREMIGFAPAWMIRVDADAAFPRFTSTTRLRHDSATYIGPLSTSTDADEWIHMLEDTFDLCRYFDVLQRAPAGERCAYYDMGKCPAPCDGTISMEAYGDMIRAALAFTLGDRATRIDAQRSRMRSAADALQFEKAASIRTTIERAEAMTAQAEYSFLCDITRCGWLTVQRASRKRRDAKKLLIKPFYIAHGGVIEGEAVSMSEVVAVSPSWIERARSSLVGDASESSGTIPPHDAARGHETLSLVSRFLFQGARAAGVYWRADRLPDAAGLTSIVRERIGNSPDTTSELPFHPNDRH